MNKIKVIELLNMISKREEVPKKIEYEGEIYEFNKNIHGYWGGKNKDCFRAMVNWRYLNNEVEIIEEEKKIPEKLEIEQDTPNSNYYIRNEYGTKCYLTKHSKIIADKVNSIIDYLNSKGDE